MKFSAGMQEGIVLWISQETPLQHTLALHISLNLDDTDVFARRRQLLLLWYGERPLLFSLELFILTTTREELGSLLSTRGSGSLFDDITSHHKSNSSTQLLSTRFEEVVLLPKRDGVGTLCPIPAPSLYVKHSPYQRSAVPRVPHTTGQRAQAVAG